MADVIKDYSYDTDVANDLVVKRSLLNDFEFTDSLEYDQKYEVDALGTTTGGIYRTNRSGTRVEINNIDNALYIYQDEIIRAYLTGDAIGFNNPSGVGSGSIYGLGTNALVVDVGTGGQGYVFTDGDFYPDPDGALDLGRSDQRWATIYADALDITGGFTSSVYNFSNGVIIRSGAGNPEGSITAPVGSLWLRSDGGAGDTLYVKESGSGNTGWVANG